MTHLDGWDDDVPYIGGVPREVLEQMIDEQGLPHPDEWASFDVSLDEGVVTAMITTDDGIEISLSDEGITLSDWMDWDWIWELWDWLSEHFPDIDKESFYEMVAG